MFLAVEHDFYDMRLYFEGGNKRFLFVDEDCWSQIMNEVGFMLICVVNYWNVIIYKIKGILQGFFALFCEFFAFDGGVWMSRVGFKSLAF